MFSSKDESPKDEEDSWSSLGLSVDSIGIAISGE